MPVSRRQALQLGLLATPVAALARQPSQATRGFHAGYFPNVELVTHEKRTVRFYDDLLKDRIVVFNFFYVGCGDTCPMLTAKLVEVQHRLGERVGREIFMNSLTLAPEVDTPERLARYAELYDVGPGWNFLTGHPADVNRARRALGRYADPKTDADVEEHSGMIHFGNEPYGRWATCPGGAGVDWIVQSILWMLGPGRIVA